MILTPKKSIPIFWDCIANILYFQSLAILIVVVHSVTATECFNSAVISSYVISPATLFLLMPSTIIPIFFHRAGVSSIVIDEETETLSIHYKLPLPFTKTRIKNIPFSGLEYCCERMPRWIEILNYVLRFIPLFRITFFSNSRWSSFVFIQSCGWAKEQYSEVITALRTVKEPRATEEMLI
ncbi:MAG: hypothetical protein PUF10_02470 [Bacteroidales bacterium]|nr:hypothetical protein [Bacteroidales bacterium]